MEREPAKLWTCSLHAAEVLLGLLSVLFSVTWALVKAWGMGHLTVFAWGHARWKLMLPQHMFSLSSLSSLSFCDCATWSCIGLPTVLARGCAMSLSSVFTTCSFRSMLEVFTGSTWQVFAFGAVTTADCPECATVVNDREIFCGNTGLGATQLTKSSTSARFQRCHQSYPEL